MKVKSLFTGRKRFVAIGGAVALALGIAGGAYAYFDSTGSGTGSATVGSANNWTVAVQSPSGATSLYPDPTPTGGVPGANTEYFPVTITNPSGGGNQNLNSVSVSVSTSNPTQCLASWFSVDGTSPTGTDSFTPNDDLAPSGTWSPSVSTLPSPYNSGYVSVELIDDNSPQDGCQGASVTLTVSAS
jgi:hypothetical protein